MTTDLDTAAQVDAVAAELCRLMRKRKGEVDPALFPSVANATRVQKEATRFGYSLEDGEELRAVLREILNRYPTKSASEHDYPFVGPALDLLGLTADTAYLTIGPRWEKASEKRGVAKLTMRNQQHEPRIAHELAVHLVEGGEEPKTLGDPKSIFDHVRHLSDESARPGDFTDLWRTLEALSMPQLRQLAVETIISYGQFANSVLRLFEDHSWSAPGDGVVIESSSRSGPFGQEIVTEVDHVADRRLGALDEDAELCRPVDAAAAAAAAGSDGDDDEFLPSLPVDDEEFLPSLHALADRGFDGLFNLLPYFMLKAEDRTAGNRFCWLARAIRALDDWMPAYPRRERDLLRHACEHAEGNIHIFLETLERTKTGKDLLKSWVDALRAEPGTDEIGAQLRAWWRGFSAVQALISPSEIHTLSYSRIQTFLLFNGRPSKTTLEDGYIVSREEGDGEWLLMGTPPVEGDKVAWRSIEDNEEDREFLRQIAIDRQAVFT